MDDYEFVFVPSIVNIDGNIEGLGIYSKESNILRRLNRNNSVITRIEIFFWRKKWSQRKKIT